MLPDAVSKRILIRHDMSTVMGLDDPLPAPGISRFAGMGQGMPVFCPDSIADVEFRGSSLSIWVEPPFSMVE